jgi:hypothetical protein
MNLIELNLNGIVLLTLIVMKYFIWGCLCITVYKIIERG